MKRAVLKIVLLCFVLCLSGCEKGEPTATQHKKGDAKKTEFSSNVYKKCTVKDYEYEIPENWEEDSADDNGGNYGNDEVQLGVVSSPIDNKVSMEDTAIQEYVENAVFSAAENYEIKQTEMTTVASEVGYRIYSLCELSGQDINTISTAFCSDDNLFIFTLWYKPESNINYMKEYDKVLASLKRDTSLEQEKTGNILLDTQIDIEPSLSGSGDVIGKWGKYNITKEALKSLTQEQFKEFMNQKVMGTLIGVVDYANIVFDDGTVLHFTPGTEIVDYGASDEEGSLVDTLGFIILRDGQYVYEQR